MNAPPCRPRFRLLLLLLLVGLVAQPGRVSAQTPAGAGAPQTSTLPNGLTVITRQRLDAESAGIAISVRAGSRDETDDFRGGAHYLEHAFFLGTTRYPTPREVFGAIARAGGDINASTTPETTTYFAHLPAARLDVAVTVLAEMLQHSTFPEAEVERERGVVQEELRGQRRTGIGALSALMLNHLVGPNAWDAGATVNDVAGIDRAALLRFRDRYYTAANMVVSVVGPQPHSEISAMIERAFTDLPRGQRIPLPPLPPEPAPASISGPTGGTPVLMAGQRIPGLSSPDAAAFALLDGILDGPGTLVSRSLEKELPPEPGAGLFQSLLSSINGTRYSQSSDHGYWAIYAGAGQDQRERTLTALRGIIAKLQTDLVTEDELDLAKRTYAGRYLISADDIGRHAILMATRTITGVYETETSYVNRVMAVTRTDIRRVAQEMLSPDQWSVLIPE